MSKTEFQPDHDPTLFEGTACYYARFRPAYPQVLFNHLNQVFRLDGTRQAMDLGCGTGQLTIPLACYFNRVVGIDPDPEMLTEARRIADEACAANVEFVLGSSADLSPALGEFRLVTMADSFHWMHRSAVLRTLHEMIPAGGGIAVISRKCDMPSGHQETVDQVIKEFLGPRRRAGQGFYCYPAERHEAVLERSSFVLLKPWAEKLRCDRTIEDTIGHLYSTSYCSKRLLKENGPRFESELRRRLFQLSPSGSFTGWIEVSALIAIRDGPDG